MCVRVLYCCTYKKSRIRMRSRETWLCDKTREYLKEQAFPVVSLHDTFCILRHTHHMTTRAKHEGIVPSVDAPAFCFCFCCCCCCCCLLLFLQLLRIPPVVCVRLLTVTIVCLAPDRYTWYCCCTFVCGCDPWRA